MGREGASARRVGSGGDLFSSSPHDLHLVSRDASNITGRAGRFAAPTTVEEVAAAVKYCVDEGVSFVARGAGTGLAGGAVPTNDDLVISLMKLNRIREVNVEGRWAWVEPGVLNADLTRAVERHRLLFAPDPSSQQSCSIGGNVGNNSGGPHCLSEGSTSAHVLALEVVLPDGTITVLDQESAPFDLRGAFVGSEGMFGIATAAKVRLLPKAPTVSTAVVGFPTIEAGALAVSAIIAGGVVPSALEMMDAPITRAVEDYVHAGFPLDAGALLIIEVEGLRHSVEHDMNRCLEICRAHEAGSVRLAENENERALIWKGRKTAFGAIARIAPNYYLHDTVVPRRSLASVLAKVGEIATSESLSVMNVFHAGDGNLHPLLLFDAREKGIMERVHRAGAEIVRVSIESGGVLSGEHGIGLEKRDYMNLMFDDADLEAQSLLRRAFDPSGRANPGKVLPSSASCGDPRTGVAGAWI